MMIGVRSSIFPLFVSFKWFIRSSVMSQRGAVRLPTLLGITCLLMADRILFQSSPPLLNFMNHMIYYFSLFDYLLILCEFVHSTYANISGVCQPLIL